MLRLIAISITSIIIGIFVFVNYSISRSVYACDGESTIAGQAYSQTVYVAFEQYRWWIVWSDSDGGAYLELSDGMTVYFPGLDKVATGWHIFENNNVRGIPDGVFSNLSNSLHIAVTDNLVFDGVCDERTG